MILEVSNLHPLEEREKQFTYLVNRVGVGRGVLLACKKGKKWINFTKQKLWES